MELLSNVRFDETDKAVIFSDEQGDKGRESEKTSTKNKSKDERMNEGENV